MIAYFDTSALSKLYYEERGSDVAESVWVACEGVTVAELAYSEMLAMFARKRREGQSEEDNARLIAEFRTDWIELVSVAIGAELRATLDLIHRDHALRGADAIHLATALRAARETNLPLHFACADERLLAAAKASGLIVERTL